MKIAILILMHKLTKQQDLLIKYLSEKFNIYIHIDKKANVNINDFNTYNNLKVYKEYKVYWGSFNQIEATISLLRHAYDDLNDRYILISGDDVPLMSCNKIYEYFVNNENEYLSYSALPKNEWAGNGGFDRITKYYPNYLRYGKYSAAEKCFNKIFMLLFGMFSFFNQRKLLNIIYWGGASWMNITSACVRQILDFVDRNMEYYNSFRHTRCADEIFFQTIICNYINSNRIINNDLRYVDWNRGPEYPRVLRIDDYDRIINSGCLFARKFDMNIDSRIIEKIYQSQMSK